MPILTGQTQQKNILKTVLTIVVIMVVILLLFFNKITTPRYLSNIELKINGLILLSEPQSLTFDSNELITKHQGKEWVLIAVDEEQKKALDILESKLKKPIKSHTIIMDADSKLQASLSKQLPKFPETIAIISPNKQLVAYFKPPFERNKMLLTYSSIFTHR